MESANTSESLDALMNDVYLTKPYNTSTSKKTKSKAKFTKLKEKLKKKNNTPK